MQRQQKQSDDVEDRHVNVLKSVNHHGVNVVTPERIHLEQCETRISYAHGEMSEVIDNEREHDESAHDHVSGRPARLRVTSIPVRLWSRATIFDCELDCEINVQDDGREEERADEPEDRAQIVEMLRVGVDPVRCEKNLQIAEQVTNDEQDQNHARDSDDHFPAD